MLRSLIEICDDEECLHLLQTENILNTFSASKSIDSDSSDVSRDEVKNSNNMPCIIALDDDTMVSYLYVCAQRAEANNLRVTVRNLLRFCSRELVRAHKKQIKLEGNEFFSLGKIQQKLVTDGSTVGEVLEIFKDIEKLVISSVAKNQSKEKLYYEDELDWFAVEAYNRGLSLSFMGDSNAQDLLAIALNILPHCGKEVQSYGAMIRKAYHDTMDRTVGGGANAATMTTETILGLFTGMP